MIGTSVMKELSQSPKLVETLFKVNIGAFSGCFLQPLSSKRAFLGLKTFFSMKNRENERKLLK